MDINEWCLGWSKRFGGGLSLKPTETRKLKEEIGLKVQRNWSDLKKRYRERKVAIWEEEWQHTRSSIDQGVPYIDDQIVSYLQPTEEDEGHRQGVLRHLTPDAFVAGRESESEARARTAKWIDLVESDATGLDVNTRDKVPLYILGCEDGPGVSINWKRLFFVSAGGIGKSTTLSWLEAEINKLPVDGDELLAFNLRPEVWGELANTRGHSFKVKLWAILAMEFFQVIFEIPDRDSLPEPIRALENEVVRLFVEPIHGELINNKAVILIDGLDHYHSEVSEGLACLQNENKEEEWPPIVLSGRAYILKGWDPRKCGPSNNKLRADLWTFCTLSEFDEEQQKKYLGQDRFDCIHQDLKGLLAVPRFLRYVRDEDTNNLKDMRTPADIFFNATNQIIRDILDKEDKHKKICLGGTSGANEIVYAKALLGAIAFEMLASETETQDGFASWEINRSNIAKVEKRLRAASVPFNAECLTNDISNVSAFGNVRPGIIDSQSSHSALIWDNKDVQSFFIAYWLANFYHQNRQDEVHPKKWIFSHVAGDEYYEINRFLADFQMRQAIPLSWVSSVSVWFEPGLKNRPSEMMHRSWSKLTRLAGEPPCDWWNTPYSTLDACCEQQEQNGLDACCEQQEQNGNAAEWSSANSLTKSKDSDYAQACIKARDTLRRFRGELQSFLKGNSGIGEKKQIAEKFINMAWCAIPEAKDFEMGPGNGKPQGFSEKSKAYWKDCCDSLKELVVRKLNDSAIFSLSSLGQDIKRKIVRSASKEFSKEFNKEKWFDGALGRLIRKKDVEWFAGMVEPIAEKAIDLHFRPGSSRSQKAMLDEVKLRVLDAIGEYWKRKDETPFENPQKIATFKLQSVPVRHSWFNLFSPGHYENVDAYLKGKDSKHTPKNSGWADQPVIFVSWFDAWAFCQWACWTENGNYYRCRLPHEPEWEFAARRNIDRGSQTSTNKVTETNYWWGDQFYECETDASTDVDPAFANYAHAGGEPGNTLDADADNIIPNGFGLKHMLGNVWEWMANVYTERKDEANPYGYSGLDPVDRSSVPVNRPRSMRGGLWYFNDLMTFCTNRFRLPPGDRDYKMGFRLVRYPCKDTASPQEEGVQENEDRAGMIVTFI
jgi:formylglycine-generating enzyme required for sulfatase activity